MNSLNDFLTYFNLDSLLAMDSSTTVYEFLGNVTVCFVAVIFTVIGFRVILEFVKILTDYKRFS